MSFRDDALRLRERATRVQTLERAYSARKFFDNERPAPRRFCAVWREDRQAPGQCWATFDSFNEAADHLADDSLDGGVFEAIFDLDTGERIDLHISTPVVTRSEEQGLLINPLQPEGEPSMVRFIAEVSSDALAAAEKALAEIASRPGVNVKACVAYQVGNSPRVLIDDFNVANTINFHAAHR